MVRRVRPNAARRIAILGDMFELGDQSDRFHRSLLERAVAQPSLREIIAIGPAMTLAASGLPRVLPAGDWRDGLADEIAATLRQGDVVLLKGSRGMKMERVLEAVRKRYPMPDHQGLTTKD